MRVNTKFSIAMHCLLFIAVYENKLKVTSTLLSQSTGCNPAEIRSILNKLQKFGIIYVVRGVGGAHLNVHPEDISLWKIYSAIENDNSKRFIGMHPNPSNTCPIGKNIESVLNFTNDTLTNSLKISMEEISLQNLLNNYLDLVKKESSKI